jgi:biopolymer transport protein ExbB/TolQ
MVRIIMSTIPILGFLGTVIGITLAIGKMDLGGNGMEEALPGVISGLSVAFDTTALALSLSTVLLFLKFYVERVEFRLLAAVDESAARQLVGRFRQYGTQSDPHLASVRRIAEELLTAVESGMQQQAALLQSSFTKSSKQWSDVLASTASTLDEALSGAVADGLTRHALMLGEGVKQFAANLEGTLIRHAELLNESLEHHTGSLSKGLKEHGGVLARGLEDHRTALVEAEGQLARENRQHLAEVEAAVGEAMLVATNRQENLIRQSENLLKEMQVALVESAGTTIAQQEQLVKQGDVLLRIVESTDQVRQLEATLNGNLEALAQSHNFQQTVSGLSAALQLMSIHLTGHPQENTRGIFEQAGKQGQNQAA